MNIRERAFVVAFLGTGRGNATKAAIVAGYSRTTARQLGSRLLSKVDIQRALQKRIEEREATEIAAANECDRILSAIPRDHLADPSDRIRAIIELNRCSGRHSVAIVHKGRLTLEEALKQSRA